MDDNHPHHVRLQIDSEPKAESGTDGLVETGMSKAFLRSSLPDGVATALVGWNNKCLRTAFRPRHQRTSQSPFSSLVSVSVRARSTSLHRRRPSPSYPRTRQGNECAGGALFPSSGIRSPDAPPRPRRRGIRRRHLSALVATGGSSSRNSGSDDTSRPPGAAGHSVDDGHLRGPSLTAELRHDLEAETAFTGRHAVDPDLRREVLAELRALTAHLWDREAPTDEPGPTGRWRYRLVLLPNLTEGGGPSSGEGGPQRVYQRREEAVAAGRDGDSAPPAAQTVLTIEPHEEVLAMSLTPDETCIACLSRDPSRGRSEVRLRNVSSSRERVLSFDHGDAHDGADGGADSVVSVEWGPAPSGGSHQSLYLLFADPGGRPCRVVVMVVGSETLLPLLAQPTPVYRNDDPSVMVDVQRTKGCAYVAIRASTKTSNEIYLAGALSVENDDGDGTSPEPASLPHNPAALTLVKHRQEGVVYHVDVGADQDVVMLVSEDGGDYAVTETLVRSLPLPSNAIDRSCRDGMPDGGGGHVASSPRNAGYCIEDMDLFRNYLVLYERSTTTGEQRIRVRMRSHGNNDRADATASSRPEGSVIDLSLASVGIPWSKLSSVGNICFDANFLRFELESPTTPGTTYEYHFESGELKKVGDPHCCRRGAKLEAPSDEAYTTEKIFVKSVDGTDVPMTIHYRTDGDSGDKRPITEQKNKTVVLVGYGAYGEPLNLGYDPGWVPLLRRGVVLAFAHARGGGDLGRAWYRAGSRENKERGIEDFEACAVYLKAHMKGVTLAAKGFSAGGILVGATVNRRPNLFDRVVLTNAFLDVYSTMLNPSLFLTEHEYDEFGDPSSDPSAAALIGSYCPVQNLQAHRHASTKFLLISALDDPNVPYWNSTLFFRKLLESGRGYCGIDGQSSRNCFLHIESVGGHTLAGPMRVSALSLENSFLLDGVEER